MNHIREEIENSIGIPVSGIVLYGSQARTDALPESDIDVLLLTESEAGKLYSGKYSFVSYTERELHDVLSRGTLMGDHLKRDSRIIYDPEGRVGEIYTAYTEPDHDRIKQEVEEAVELLGICEEQFRLNPYNFLYLARYLCRTSGILLHKEVQGQYNYSNRSVAQVLNLPELNELGFHHSPNATDWLRFVSISRLCGRILFDAEDVVLNDVDIDDFIEKTKITKPRLANLAYGLVRPEKISPIRVFSIAAYESFPYVHPDTI